LIPHEASSTLRIGEASSDVVPFGRRRHRRHQRDPLRSVRPPPLAWRAPI
jgi:hypothetical protein